MSFYSRWHRGGGWSWEEQLHKMKQPTARQAGNASKKSNAGNVRSVSRAQEQKQFLEPDFGEAIPRIARGTTPEEPTNGQTTTGGGQSTIPKNP